MNLGGLGEGITRSLALGNPARLVLVASPSNIGDIGPLVTALRESSRDAIVIDLTTMDVSSLSSVRKVADEILADVGIAQIDGLINVPIEMPGPYAETEDGLERLLQNNYLSHFLFTNKVLPKVLLAANPRVVNVSSSANTISGMHWDDLNFKLPGAYEQWTAYGQTKTAGVLFSVALNTRFVPSVPRFRSYAVHPGGVKTRVQEQLSAESLKWAYEGTKKKFGEATAKEFFTWKTLDAASSTPLRAALDHLLAEREGMWLQDCELFPDSVHLAPWSKDPENAQRLWKMSEDLVNESF